MASNVREFFRQILMFDDEDFAPASVTKIPIPHEPTASQAGQGSTQNKADTDIEPLTPDNSKQRADSSEVNTPAAVHVTIQISPLPRAAHSSSKTGKCKADTAIALTSMPNKRALEEKQRE